MVSYKALNTIRKRTVANTGHGVGDSDGLQGFATTKRIAANAGHGVGDGDGMQELASIKRTIANARHGVRNDKISSL